MSLPVPDGLFGLGVAPPQDVVEGVDVMESDRSKAGIRLTTFLTITFLLFEVSSPQFEVEPSQGFEEQTEPGEMNPKVYVIYSRRKKPTSCLQSHSLVIRYLLVPWRDTMVQTHPIKKCVTSLSAD